MFRKLLQTGQVDVNGDTYQVHYFELKTARGARRFYGCYVVPAAVVRLGRR